MQSAERPPEFVVMHVWPARAPRSQVPVAGVLGEPTAVQRGHGCVLFPVIHTWDERGAPSDIAPLEVSSVPPAFEEKVFTTHVDRPPFTIGSGGPKRHPATVQSTPSAPPGLADSVQLLPAQLLTTKRFVAPSGIGPSGTVEPPPPRFSEPQARLRIVPPPLICDTPHGPLPLEVVKSSTTVPGGGIVDVDVLELVEVLDVEVEVEPAEVDVVDVVGTVVGGVVSTITTVPGNVTAPGPGNEVAPLMIPLALAPTQNTDARVVEAGTPTVRGPAGSPASRIRRHDVELGFVKHPA